MRFYINQQAFSFTSKFSVMNEQMEEVFRIEGEFMSFKNRLHLLDMRGNEILYTEKEIFTFLPRYTIYQPGGVAIASINQKFAFFKPVFQVFEGNDILHVEGDFWGHNFTILKNGQNIASITKEYFTIGDKYVIDIGDEDKDLLYLFIVIVVDQAAEAARRRNS
jgi:uncharacterized protein YxjI